MEWVGDSGCTLSFGIVNFGDRIEVFDKSCQSLNLALKVIPNRMTLIVLRFSLYFSNTMYPSMCAGTRIVQTIPDHHTILTGENEADLDFNAVQRGDLCFIWL